MAKERILLWGGRSQARVVDAHLRLQGRRVGYIFDYSLDEPQFETSAEFLNTPEHLSRVLSRCTGFVVCIGGNLGAQRRMISKHLMREFDLEPVEVISDTAIIDPEATVGKGVQIMSGACIGVATTISDFAIVNTNATVDHECLVGPGVHVMGAAAVAGCVTIGADATIGTNATVLPKLTIQSGAQVGAASLIRRDVSENSVVVGVPARHLRTETRIVDTSVVAKLRG
ncbi:UDP-N-acetylbacillosamine N-acetyltransferase [Roseovarius sp. THAF9]|uniref:hypothetical protein n=1 Tax=Roseovarius sp. THAF9 TaxID=2587847 RepID=UPI001268A31B|nr:hypothetical protein [Roseovarius sp. THAF9]QFT91355.1 UDP-N-acetylbacillosamine N-acetyltransferase [Roseovarius sp. THAF9]